MKILLKVCGWRGGCAFIARKWKRANPALDLMKHYYSTVNDVVLTHSDMQYKDHSRRVLVRFERPNEQGFDFAEGMLPECVFTKLSGFSENEIFDLIDYLRCNSLLIWDYSQKGGGVNA